MTQNGPYQDSVPGVIEKIVVGSSSPMVIAWVHDGTCGEFVAQAGPYVARGDTVGEVVRSLARRREPGEEEGSRGVSIPLTDEARRRIAVERFVARLRGMNPDEKLSENLDRLLVEYGLEERPAIPDRRPADPGDDRNAMRAVMGIMVLVAAGTSCAYAWQETSSNAVAAGVFLFVLILGGLFSWLVGG